MIFPLTLGRESVSIFEVNPKFLSLSERLDVVSLVTVELSVATISPFLSVDDVVCEMVVVI